MDQRTVSVVLVDGFELLDVFGPAELFGLTPGIEVELLHEGVRPVASSQGAEVVPDRQHRDVETSTSCSCPADLACVLLLPIDHSWSGSRAPEASRGS
jgi:putative intracellular protease/amidase